VVPVIGQVTLAAAMARMPFSAAAVVPADPGPDAA